MEEVDSLIEKLAQLHLQQTALRKQEQDILQKLLSARGKDLSNFSQDHTGRRVPTPTANHVHPTVHRIHQEGYRIGDRVRITNRIDTNFGRPHNERDRTGVVTKITAKRVFLRTDNNNVTSRSPNNLIPCSQNE